MSRGAPRNSSEGRVLARATRCAAPALSCNALLARNTPTGLSCNPLLVRRWLWATVLTVSLAVAPRAQAQAPSGPPSEDAAPLTPSERAQPAQPSKESAAAAWRAGRVEWALLLWQLHLARQPKDAEARAAYARALASLKRYDEAIVELRRVLADHPKDVDVRTSLARVLGWKGDTKAGIAEAERALDVAPHDAAARLALADLFSWSRRFVDAIPHYLIVLDAKDVRAVRHQLVRNLIEARYDALALHHVRKLLRDTPKDLELLELARTAEESGLVGLFEIALSAYEAERVHPWWRLQLSTQWAATSSWRLGVGIEHFWRAFQPRGAPAPPEAPTGFVRDTTLSADAWYRGRGPWSASFNLTTSPQATFNPRVAFEGAFAYELLRGLDLGMAYKGFGFDGQYAHLLVPTLVWHFRSYALTARYYFAVVQPFGDDIGGRVVGSTQAGHAASVRVRGDLLPKLSWSAGVGGGLSFVTAGLGPTTNPSVSASLGFEVRPTLKNGLRIDYEYVNERLGDTARFGVAWHALRLAYFRRY